MVRSKSLLILLALIIFGSSIFCCCLENISHASEVAAVSHLPDCHRQEDDAAAPAREECQCQEIIGVAFERTSTDDQPGHYSFVRLELIVNALMPPAIELDHSKFAIATAPPGRAGDPVPFYIQYSNLRI